MPVGLPMPGEEFRQTGLRHLGDASKDVGEPGLGVDVVELGGADERVHHRRALAAAIGAREQPGFASQTERPERPLGRVVGEADDALHRPRDRRDADLRG